MSLETTFILRSLALAAVAFLLVSALITWSWRQLVGRLSPGGALAIAFYGLFFCSQPLCWCLSLIPSWQNLRSPVLMGIGGGAYGLDYTLYPTASLIFILIGSVPTVIAVLFARRAGDQCVPPNLLFRSNVTQVMPFLVRVQWLLLVATLMLSFVIFSTRGWETLWYSPIERFESGSVGGLASILGLAKLWMPVLLLLGIVQAVLLGFSREQWIPTAGVVTSMVPFACFSSRGFTVIVIAACAAWLVRLRWPLWLRISLLVAVGAYALLIPLVGRASRTTGLKVFLEAHQTLWNGEQNATMTNPSVALLQNVSQGFPILVEALENKQDHSSIVEGVPPMFWIISVLPTISVIDGYSESYVHYNPRVNYFTPFSALAMLIAFSYVATIVFYATILIITLWLLRLLSKRGPMGVLGAVLVLVAFSQSIVQSTQYDVRTTVRFLYVGWFCGAICWLLGHFFRSLPNGPVGNQSSHLTRSHSRFHGS